MTYEDHVKLRTECLRLAKQNASIADITNALTLAQEYYEWVCDVDKRRLKRQSESHAV